MEKMHKSSTLHYSPQRDNEPSVDGSLHTGVIHDIEKTQHNINSSITYTTRDISLCIRVCWKIIKKMTDEENVK